MDTDDLRVLLDEIEQHSGSGTELVSVTVPHDSSITSTQQRIAQEYAEAENIKSDETRDHVQRALDRIKRELSEYTQTPTDGLVAYAGVVDDELVAYCLDEFPEPITSSIYNCDDSFDTTPLDDIVAPDDIFGLVVLERGKGAVGRLVGDTVVTERELDSHVMGKTRAGGQSAQRFARERERQLHEFFESVADVANNAFIDGDEVLVSGVVVGGTLTTAQQFVDADYLDFRLGERVLGTYGVEYGNEQGLERLVEKASSELLSASQLEARQRLETFFERLRDGEKVTYGADSVEQATEFGAVDTLLIQPSHDLREALGERVEQQGGTVTTVRGEGELGERFCNHFDGIGALCRFPVE